MRNKYIFFIILIFTPLFITGCNTAVPYSFAENESETATITFITNGGGEGVDLHYFEDNELPIPKRNAFWQTGSYWSPVIFPAGRPFKLLVNVYYFQTQKGNVRTFNCPALTAGKDYKLKLEIKDEKKVLFIKISEREEKLVLTDANTKAVVYEQKL